MTIELIMCLVLGFAAYPVSKGVALHFAIFAIVNAAMIGYESFDASLLTMVFAFLASADALIAAHTGRFSLLLSAIAGVALSVESMTNHDWLLNHVTYISVAVNAAIVLGLVREYRVWTHGKFGRL